MGLNTYPSNPFPPSTDRMDADTLEAEVNELKSGLTNVHDNFTDVIGWDKRKNLYNGSVSADGAFATAYELPSGLTTITISAKKTSDCPQINTLIYDNEGNIIVNYTKLIDASNTSGHVTVTLNKQGYIAIYPVSGGASNINKVFDIQVEKGSTATSYEPYHPVIGPAVEELQSGLTDLSDYAVKYIRMPGNDGRHYSRQISSMVASRFGMLILVFTVNGYVKTIGVSVDNQNGANDVYFSDNAASYDKDTKTITVDSGANAWAYPMIYYPSTFVSFSS